MKIDTNEESRIIGLMSGTSLDGVDLIDALFSGGGKKPNYRIEGSAFSEYPSKLVREIQRAMSEGGTERICKLNFDLAGFYAEVVQSYLSKNGIERKEIDLIGCHGQTIYHLHRNATLQIGDGSVLANQVGIPCVHNFRTADVALGGAGAPLVCVLDRYLAGKTNRDCVFLNLGGIGNLTLVPADSQGRITAFDTGPANLMLNWFAAHFTREKLSCDFDGTLSEGGRTDADLMEYLMGHPYLEKDLPKTTGHEDFGKAYCRQVLQRFRKLEKNHLLYTLADFSAKAVAFGLKRFAPDAEMIFVTGGGKYHPVIQKKLREYLPKMEFMDFAKEFGLDPDQKEAFLMAFLAYYHQKGIPGNLPEVTGAKAPALLGQFSQIMDRLPPVYEP